jgi:PHP domain
VRTRLLAAAALLAVAYAVFGALVVRDRARRGDPAIGAAAVRGAFHVHTTRSDGLGTLDEVVRAAKEAGLQFVVVTDHNVLTPEEQGYRDGVLVVEATEASTAFGHVVALRVPRALTREEREGDPLGAIRALGGEAVLAHPFHPRRPFTGWGRGPWRGFEVVSNDTSWGRAVADRSVGKVVTAALTLPFDRARAVVELGEDPSDELARFDEEVAAARAAGERRDPARVLLCSADAHGYPSYRAAFEAFSTYLPITLTGDGARDAAAVTAALLDGSAVCVFDAIAPGGVVRLGRGRAPGTLELGPAALLAGAEVVIVKDGKPVEHALSAGETPLLAVVRCEGGCGPGSYRVEARRGGRRWILTNPSAIE